MLRVSLTSKYVFQVLEDYSIALYFRKFYLRNIFDNMRTKDVSLERYRYSYYKNIVAENLEKIFNYIENTGKSKYLRDLGKTCRNNMKKYINVIDTSQNFSLSLNLSAIQNNNGNVNESVNQSAILDQSSFPAINETVVI